MENYLINKLGNPIYAVENGDILISKEKGVLSYGFKVQYPSLYGKTEKSLNEIKRVYDNILQILDENYIIQKTDYFFPSLYEDQASSDFIRQSNFLHFKDRKIFNQISYLFISLVPENYIRSTSLDTNSFLKKEEKGNIFTPYIDKKYIDSLFLKDFTRKKEAITSLLSKSIIKGELLDEESKIDELIRYWENLSLEKNKISDVIFEDGNILVSGKKYKTYTIEKLEQLPDFLNEFEYDSQKKGNGIDNMYLPKSLLSPLGAENLTPHVLNQFFYIPPQETFLKNLKKQENRLLNFSNFFANADASQSKTIDEEKNEVYKNQITEFKDDILNNHQKVVYTHVNLLAEDLLIDKDFPIIMKENSIDTGDIYLSTLGSNGIGLPVDLYMPLTSNQAFSFFYCEDYSKGNSATGFRVIDITSGNPEKLDILRTNKKNKLISAYNGWIVGKTGSGKSFLANKFLLHYFFSGEHIFNVDGSSSYERATKFVNFITEGKHGFFLNITPNSKIGLNPFLFNETDDISSKINFLSGLLGILLRTQVDPVHNTFFMEVLQEYYTVDMVRNFNTLYEFISENGENIVNENGIKELVNINTIKFLLKPFYKGGTYDFLLNSTDERLKTLNSNRYVTFQIKELKDDSFLFSIITFLLTNFYKTKLYDKKFLKDIKIINYDEAWTMADKPHLESFFVDTIKTVRSQNGSTWFTTQEPEDFLKSDIIRNTVINNSDLGIVLDLAKYEGKKEDLKYMLSLTDDELKLILSLGTKLPEGINCREFALKVGKHTINTYGLEVSNEERAIYESDPEEKVVLAEIDKKSLGNPIITAREYANRIQKNN
ncbi:VirB4 family type IV secretion system protein [Elizabethkingia ursingii]